MSEPLGKRVDRLGESIAQTQQLIAELAIETRRGFDQVAEQFRETDRQFRETDRRFREVNDSFRELRDHSRESDARVDKLVSAIGEFIRVQGEK